MCISNPPPLRHPITEQTLHEILPVTTTFVKQPLQENFSIASIGLKVEIENFFRRTEREEIQYRKAKAIWITYNLDYIYEKPERTQESLLQAVRTNKKYLKDIKEKVWNQLVSDRKNAYEKMVKWKEEQEYALKHGKKKDDKKEEENKQEEEEEGEQTKESEVTQEETED